MRIEKVRLADIDAVIGRRIGELLFQFPGEPAVNIPVILGGESRIGIGREQPYIIEGIRMVRRQIEGLQRSVGHPGDRTAGLRRNGPVAPVREGDHVVQEVPLRFPVLQPEGAQGRQAVPVVVLPVAVVAVHVRHHKDEIRRQAAVPQGIQSVENVGAVDPGLLVAPGPVEKIEHGIAPERIPIVIRRQIHDHAPLGQLRLAAGIVDRFDDTLETRQAFDVTALRAASVTPRGTGTKPGCKQEEEQEASHRPPVSSAPRNMAISASALWFIS